MRETSIYSYVYGSSSKTENIVSKTINFIGWAEIVCGIICGIYFGGHYYKPYLNGGGRYVSQDFVLMKALIWWIGSIITGLFIIGFAEIIKLLQRVADSSEEININSDRFHKTMTASTATNNSTQNNDQ